ncbi:hypothetical protein VaNZ11_017094 [Volvox africanus]|uniref:HhH-GPD domain-containing protein n=1 Tax=Volvox africanus TaxID=51714 RepID=A0ABQ5SPE0_9CHLO|nr:hypothetical protein VaNZ11_017094 [Volvox africanus]
MQQTKTKNAELVLAAHTSIHNSAKHKTFSTISAPIEPSPSLPRLQLEKALIPTAEHPLEQLNSIGVHLRDRLRNQIIRSRQTQISASSSPSDTQPHHPHTVDVSKANPKPSDMNQRNVQHMPRRLRRRFVVVEKSADAKDVAFANAADAVAIAATAVSNAVTSEPAAASAAMEEAAFVPSPLLPQETLPHGATRRSEWARTAATTAAAAARACQMRRGRRRPRSGAAAVAVAVSGAAVAQLLPRLHTGTQMAVPVVTDDPPQTDPRISTWIPPASPWGLIEEVLYDNPWRLLVACILLNRTTGRQVRQVIGPLWRAYPTAEAMAIADPRVVQDIVRPLGLHAVRAARLVRFSQEFISKEVGKL